MPIRTLLLTLATLTLFHATPIAASSAACNARTLSATVRHSECVVKATAKNWLQPNGARLAKRVQRCDQRITRAFNRARRQLGSDSCTQESVASYVQASTQFVNVIADVTNEQADFDLCSSSQVDLVGGACGTLLGVAAGEIPGCDGTPYIQPQTPLTAGAWFWDDDGGVDPTAGPKIATDHFQWGGYCTNTVTPTDPCTKVQRKQAIADDLMNNASGKTKTGADDRIKAIEDLNLSHFQKNAGGASIYFKLTYIYSEDIALLYSAHQMGLGIDQINQQKVIFFDKGMNDPNFVTGTVNGNNIETESGQIIAIDSSLDQVQLKSAYDMAAYWLTELKSIGVAADYLFSASLVGTEVQDWTINAMLLAARYNVYARAQSPALPTYNYFNIDSEPGNEPALQQTYLDINSAILNLFGPGTKFDMGIAAYVNQQQMNQPTASNSFAGKTCAVAQEMIFGSYRGDPKAQCQQASTLCSPSTDGRCANHPWTIAWEGSLDPVGAHALSPMCNAATVANVREMADIAIAEAAGCSTPLTVDANPQVSFSSFLPLWAQLVRGGYTCP